MKDVKPSAPTRQIDDSDSHTFYVPTQCMLDPRVPINQSDDVACYSTQAAAVIKDASENPGHRAALCWPKAGSANDHQNATTRTPPSPCQTSPVVFHTLADNVEGNLDVMVASFLATQVRR